VGIPTPAPSCAYHTPCPRTQPLFLLKDFWDNFIDWFKQAFTNQNQRNEAYQALCQLKQEGSIDNFFASFKQLANKAGVSLDDKGTIETLKHAMDQALTRAIIQSSNFDPNADHPWTFKQWEKQARKSHQKWKATTQFSQQKQGLFKAFGVSPRQNPAKNNHTGGNTMDVDANILGRGQQHSEAKKAKLMKENKCFYCKIKRHQAYICCKKQVDSARSSQSANNKTIIQNQDPIDMTPNDIFSFLKDNMSLLDEDTKLSIIEQVFKLHLRRRRGRVYFKQNLSIHQIVFYIYTCYGVTQKTQRKTTKKKKENIPQTMHSGCLESLDQVQHRTYAHMWGPAVAA